MITDEKVYFYPIFFRMFKARLLVELSAVFPNEMKFYRANRVDERGNQ